jgi:parvulin-like peptidyl-prolyl isomerase
MLPDSLQSASAREISAVFGNALAEAISGAERGAWSGPYPSSYGLHLIDLTEVEKGGVPTLAQVRSAVEREWWAERRRAANDVFFQALRERYRVEIHLPDDRPATPDMAASDQ